MANMVHSALHDLHKPFRTATVVTKNIYSGTDPFLSVHFNSWLIICTMHERSNTPSLSSFYIFLAFSLSLFALYLFSLLPFFLFFSPFFLHHFVLLFFSSTSFSSTSFPPFPFWLFLLFSFTFFCSPF